MKQLLRFKIFQETACYQKPFAFKVGETYPLVPFSTIKGLLHALLEADKYIPLDISIQGKFETMLIDYQKKYMYKKKEAQIPFIIDGLGVELEPEHVTSMPMYQHLLFHVEHVFHVDAQPEILQQLYDKLTNPDVTLSLGRWEDLVRIDEVTLVEVTKDKLTQHTSYDIYVPEYDAQELREFKGENNLVAYYRMPKKYTIINGRRVWDYSSVALVQQNQKFISKILTDGEYPIFLIKG
ncbi:type I-B CRISPR-associated protein Cas5b [Lysinibacillus sp. 54212]|uniref:type I-B CRISPR-associated protein Cas5b n=1 Tax=Lysinibacillus sp. 54212 TaxID=3119829 RepID=UPI002FCAB194